MLIEHQRNITSDALNWNIHIYRNIIFYDALISILLNLHIHRHSDFHPAVPAGIK